MALTNEDSPTMQIRMFDKDVMEQPEIKLQPAEKEEEELDTASSEDNQKIVPGSMSPFVPKKEFESEYDTSYANLQEQREKYKSEFVEAWQCILGLRQIFEPHFSDDEAKEDEGIMDEVKEYREEFQMQLKKKLGLETNETEPRDSLVVGKEWQVYKAEFYKSLRQSFSGVGVQPSVANDQSLMASLALQSTCNVADAKALAT